MPLFTKFKKAKDAASEHSKAQGTAPKKTPYKHIPTHAAQDALSLSPTTVRPEELQARIAAARKRRASSYDPSLPARRAVYHSCESSRQNSRANSTAASSRASSFKGKARGDEYGDIMGERPQMVHRHSMPLTITKSNDTDHASPLLSDLILPPAFPQRPRPYQSSSRRSSFTKKKSPLSVSVEEDTTDPSPAESSSSSTSSERSNSGALAEAERHSKAVNTPFMPIEPPKNKTNSSIKYQPQAATPVRRPKSIWGFLPRKSVSVAAH